MSRLQKFAAVLLIFAGCSRNVADMPAKERQANWGNPGACAYASMMTLLRAEGYDTAATSLGHYDGPAWTGQLQAALEPFGVRLTETETGDESFLEHACQVGPGCEVCVDWNGQTDPRKSMSHAVDLIYLDGSVAGVCDCNDPQHIFYVPRADFLREWHRCGGCAVRPLQWWEPF